METDLKVLLANLSETEHTILLGLLRASIEANSENIVRMELMDICELKCTCGECPDAGEAPSKEMLERILKGAREGLAHLKSLYHKLK